MADLTISERYGERTDRSAAGREQRLRSGIELRRPPGVLRQRQVRRPLETDRERGYARRFDLRHLLQLPGQGSRARCSAVSIRTTTSRPSATTRTVEETGADDGQVLCPPERTDDNYGQWGNFKIGYMNNELAQVDRGLYGANFALSDGYDDRFRRPALSSSMLFAAEPGTMPSREIFRGTGGSLVLPEAPGHPGRFGAGAHRDPRQGVGHRHGRREPDARPRLRRRLPAGPDRTLRAARVDRR